MVASTTKRNGEWEFLGGIPSDIEVRVGDAIFTLHKFPMISKSGRMRKMLAGGNKVAHLDLTGVPGGADAFAMAARFCYGQSVDITAENVAAIRCAAEYLEMTELCAGDNLLSRADAFLEDAALTTAAGALAVLRRCEELAPAAEAGELGNRCIDALASILCREGAGLAGHDDWWADEVTVLGVNVFRRLVGAMTARGFKGIALGALIMLYGQKSLRGLDLSGGSGMKAMEAEQEHEKRAVLETVVGLLPEDGNTISVSFLSMLLRAASHLGATVACRLELEKRMAMQLGHAALDDLLIPTFAADIDGDTAFDVDAVRRILAGYLELEAAEGQRLDYATDDDYAPSPVYDARQVGRLIELYLAEVASDRNLTVDKLVGLAELIPERARYNDDGMYRAIDIFLKAHPGLSDGERRRVCGLMDWRKLSREACAHAAQNDRLPVQTVVQVLASEQQRLRSATISKILPGESPAPMSGRTTPYSTRGDEVSRLQRENDALRMELLRLKMRASSSAAGGVAMPSAEKPPLPKKSFMGAVSKKLSKLNPFARFDGGAAAAGAKTRARPAKDRRHSIS